MNSFVVLPLALLAFSATDLARQQEPADPDQTRAEFSRALKDWDQTDDNLVRDAYRLPVVDALSRVDLAEQKRTRLDEARRRYSASFLKTNQAQIAALKAGGLSADSIRAIQRQVLEEVRVGLDALAVQARRLSLSDRARSEELQVSRTQLEGLRAAVDRHAAQLAADETPAGIERARAATLSDVMQIEIAAGRSDPTDWKKSYAQLRDDIRRRGSSKSAAEAESAAAASSGPQLMLPTLAGIWAYSNPDAQKKNGVYQWKVARLEITQKGDSVEGSYICRLAVPEGEKLNPEVKLSFRGRIVSEIMKFDLQPPLKGWFRILKNSAAELTISYYISNPRQTGISFGEIPDNDPQTLLRQAQ